MEGGKIMRSKTLGINVRVTAAEKEKLSENAFYCGLSLSEYLRRLGLGKNVKAATDEKIYKAFRLVRQQCWSNAARCLRKTAMRSSP